MQKGQEFAKYRRLFKFPKLKFVVNVFLHRDAILRAVYERRNDKGTQKVAIQGHAFMSNPTEVKALQNITLLECVECDDGFWIKQPEKWLWVIDKAVEACPDDACRKAIELWIAGYEPNYIADTVGMSRTSYYDFRKEVQHYALALAAQLGLINVLMRKDVEKDGNNQENNQENSQEG